VIAPAFDTRSYTGFARAEMPKTSTLPKDLVTMTGQDLLPHLDSNQEPFGLRFEKSMDVSTSFVCTKTAKSVELKKINIVGVSRGVAA
jgi:hypothetical protein